MRFKVGQIVLFNNPKTLFGRLITKYNMDMYGSSYTTHVGIITAVYDNSIAIFESLIDGFNSHVYTKDDIEERIKLGEILIRETKKPLNMVLENCYKYEGIKYGILDIFMIAFYWATRIKISLTRKNSLICSEAVVRVLYDSSNKKVDFVKEFEKPYDLITPMDLYISKQLI